MTTSSPLTAARAAHSAAQAALAQAAAEVERLEAEAAKKPSVGKLMAEAAIYHDGVSCHGDIAYRFKAPGGANGVLFNRPGDYYGDGERLEDVRRVVAALIDAALAERSAAPQPAELPEGETPERFVREHWWEGTATLIRRIAARDALHAARTQRAVAEAVAAFRHKCAAVLESQARLDSARVVRELSSEDGAA